MTETEIPTSETQEVLEPTIEDMIQAEDGVPFTTSLAIAQAFGKEHKNVLRDIQNLECSSKFRELNFELSSYTAETGNGTIREYPAYRLTRDGFAILAMGFNGQKAVAWKERFLEAFNAMEAALLKQQRQKEAERLERRYKKELAEQKKLEQEEQPQAPAWQKPPFFQTMRKLTKGQTDALLGLISMESLIQDRQSEDMLKELLNTFHIANLEDMRQPHYKESVYLIMRRMFQAGTEPAGASPVSQPYSAAVDGLISFWNNSSAFSRGDIYTYVQNKCGVSIADGLASDKTCLKVLFALWCGIASNELRIQ